MQHFSSANPMQKSFENLGANNSKVKEKDALQCYETP